MSTSKNTHLVFLENGTEVKIIFSNKKESIEYESKNDAVAAIFNLSKIGKITDHELMTLTNEVLNSTTLPQGKELSESFRIEMLKKAVSLLKENFNGKIPIVVIATETKEPNVAYFQICPTAGPIHGHIYTKHGCLKDAVTSQYKGLLMIRGLIKEGDISKEEEEKLIKEVTSSPLPKVGGLEAQA